MKNPHVSALAAAHGAAVLFGLTGILGALIRFDAVAITAGRAGFAATALLVLALTQRRPLLQGLGPRRAGIVLASGFLLAVHWITFFMAVKVGGVAVATLGFASFPAFIALLDVVLFRERIGPAEGTMLALVTLGLVLVTPSFDVGDQGTVGLLWGLASGLSFAGLPSATAAAIGAWTPSRWLSGRTSSLRCWCCPCWASVWPLLRSLTRRRLPPG